MSVFVHFPPRRLSAWCRDHGAAVRLEMTHEDGVLSVVQLTVLQEGVDARDSILSSLLNAPSIATLFVKPGRVAIPAEQFDAYEMATDELPVD
ncbi:hypothetical protein [Aeromonas caviae]|uniref:hypothetical protein n=1 Tax=Aeromonas caviae TaxID=648 RepID=UPI002B47BBF5|nr:hypothetical protein [Aeromonas caviae]